MLRPQWQREWALVQWSAVSIDRRCDGHAAPPARVPRKGGLAGCQHWVLPLVESQPPSRFDWRMARRAALVSSIEFAALTVGSAAESVPAGRAESGPGRDL